MREFLVVVGLAVLALGLRSSRRPFFRKLGALGFLAVGGAIFYFLTDSWLGALLGFIPWLLLPWVELLTRIRRMRLPMENRLRHRTAPDPAFFPHASEAEEAMEDVGFDHAENCGWEWSGMQQYLKLHWNPEERAEAAICLCEQEDVAFAFITVTSRGDGGRIWRTTNYPFSPTLKCPPQVRWNHVPCDRHSFHEILADHRGFLKKMKVDSESVRIPDPDDIEQLVEAEMKSQIRHNLEAGIIEQSGDHHFKYSVRGMLFLWGQFLKDMIRLC